MTAAEEDADFGAKQEGEVPSLENVNREGGGRRERALLGGDVLGGRRVGGTTR